jgi:formylglycine-generating enzyme required for sulfatase activity
MNRNICVFISLMMILTLVACASDTIPTAEPTMEDPTSTPVASTEEPTRTPMPEPTSTPTPVPPTAEPEPSVWEPQRPGSPCEPYGTRTCNILYIFTDQYDDDHVLKTENHFEMAGYSTFVASNTLEEIRGFHACYDFTPAYPDMLLEDVDVTDFDVILFVGSDGDTTDLHYDPEAHRVAREAMERRMVVAAVGDGPVVLARGGLLEGRTVTVLYNYRPFGIGEQWRSAVERGGGTYVERSLARDGLLVTADFATTAFAWGIIEVATEIEPEAFSLGDAQVRPADGMAMVYVPSGEFEMGAPGTGDTNRMPIHTVFLDGFWLDQTEVTNGQYAQCVAAGICEPSLYADFERYNGENQPIVAVTWHDAATYCEWVGGSLPTEAQWEYAARGSDNSTYPWGEDAPDCDRANYLECVGTTADVGFYPAGASWCGALDLAGNVYEWVADWSASYTGERQVNPVGPETGERKIIRGGSWVDPAQNLLAAQRIRYGRDEASDTVGFRCVVSAED